MFGLVVKLALISRATGSKLEFERLRRQLLEIESRVSSRRLE
jgi:hypothetical protein